MTAPPPVRELAATAQDAVTDTLVEAFRDYPVMRYVLGGGGDYAARLATLVGYFVSARVVRGEVLLGIGVDDDHLDGVALVSRSDVASPRALAAARSRVWQELGEETRMRYQAYGAATASFEIDRPHLHLNMIGVRDRARGRGLGRALIEHVHGLSVADPSSVGVTLATEHPANVTLYEHFGYRIVGEADVSPTLHSWGFYRPDA